MATHLNNAAGRVRCDVRKHVRRLKDRHARQREQEQEKQFPAKNSLMQHD
jgi:hypothetical protein